MIDADPSPSSPTDNAAPRVFTRTPARDAKNLRRVLVAIARLGELHVTGNASGEKAGTITALAELAAVRAGNDLDGLALQAERAVTKYAAMKPTGVPT